MEIATLFLALWKLQQLNILLWVLLRCILSDCVITRNMASCEIGFEFVLKNQICYTSFDALISCACFKGKESKIIWNHFMFAILWAIWGERNNRIFEGVVYLEDELWEKICFWVATWLKNVKTFRFLPFSDLTRSLAEGFYLGG